MLDKNKVAEKLAEKNGAPVGGPPGKPKVNKVVQKQLAKLIGASASVEEAPVQTVAKPSSKKAMKWAVKKFGEEGVATMAQGNGMSPKKWAIAKYSEHLAAKAKGSAVTEQRPNEAMQALVSGAEKRAAKKETKESEAASRDKEIKTALTKLKVSTDEQLKSALGAFIDGPIKSVMEAFVTLYVSRETDGDSDEAVLALDACRQAFDACGLVLADVETKSKKGGKRNDVMAAIARGELDPSSSETGRLLAEEASKKSPKKSTQPIKKERVRKPLTKAQREAKNKKDRERRAAAKKGGKK